MPWDGQTFRERHAKHLSPAQADRAARVANAMLKNGTPEGEAIATGIARGKGQKPKKHARPFGSLAPAS